MCAIRIIRRRSAISFRRSPRTTDKRCIKVNGEDRCKIAIQTNNVDTDDRGYIYIVDRANTGMHILELTGEARRSPGCRDRGCCLKRNRRPLKPGTGGSQIAAGNDATNQRDYFVSWPRISPPLLASV